MSVGTARFEGERWTGWVSLPLLDGAGRHETTLDVAVRPDTVHAWHGPVTVMQAGRDRFASWLAGAGADLFRRHDLLWQRHRGGLTVRVGDLPVLWVEIPFARRLLEVL
jgi:hypothetical protein